MTSKEKEWLVATIIAAINSIPIDNQQPSDEVKISAHDNPEPVEMLTVKECSQLIKGLSEGTVRQLVAQRKVPHIRAGAGERGRILIPKAALINYCSTTK